LLETSPHPARAPRADHAEIAVTIGEQSLLPAVRGAADATLILADGFSCREQIRLGTGHHAMHPAERVVAALQSRRDMPARMLEERYREPAAAPRRESLAAALALGTLAAALLFVRSRARAEPALQRR
jgi:hypothetical protein